MGQFPPPPWAHAKANSAAYTIQGQDYTGVIIKQGDNVSGENSPCRLTLLPDGSTTRSNGGKSRSQDRGMASYFPSSFQPHSLAKETPYQNDVHFYKNGQETIENYGQGVFREKIPMRHPGIFKAGPLQQNGGPRYGPPGELEPKLNHYIPGGNKRSRAPTNKTAK